MKPLVLLAAALSLALVGCQKKKEAPAAPASEAVSRLFQHPGRYQSAGLYMPSRLWTQLADAESGPAKPGAPKPAIDPASATLNDDGQIIVVVDSATGEVRQCGNLSGRCVRLNPWARTNVPIALTKHEADFEREEAAEAARLARGASRPTNP